MFTQTSALLALAATASAHIIMQNPVPFEWEDAGTKQFPLEVSQFPCKQPSGAYKVSKMNEWNAGETKGVKLIGGATHGGGSCQFSITTDTKPTKDSQWKVIHTQIGGCPGGSPHNQNTDNDPNSNKIPEIDVTMPADLPDGQYTFAWSWLNKVGNREFYMNCAPIQVGSAGGATGSADVSSVLGSLPDMFTINLPATECSNTIYQDFEYPDPGPSVVRAPTAEPGADTTGSGCAAMAKLGAGAGSLGAPAKGDSPTKPSDGNSNGSTPSDGDKPVASTKPAPEPKPETPAEKPKPETPATQPTTPANGTPAEGSADCSPCTNDGAVVCIGSDKFGICNRGCAVPQPMAAGMTCTNGAMAAAAIKRHIHFPRAHLRRLSH